MYSTISIQWYFLNPCSLTETWAWILAVLIFGAHFTKKLWAHNPNLVKTQVAFPSLIMFWSCHNFAHATTAQLSWHVQNCDMIGASKYQLEEKELSQNLNYELIKHWWNRSQPYDWSSAVWCSYGNPMITGSPWNHCFACPSQMALGYDPLSQQTTSRWSPLKPAIMIQIKSDRYKQNVRPAFMLLAECAK